MKKAPMVVRITVRITNDDLKYILESGLSKSDIVREALQLHKSDTGVPRC